VVSSLRSLIWLLPTNGRHELHRPRSAWCHWLSFFWRVLFEHLFDRFLHLFFIAFLGVGDHVHRGLTPPNHFFLFHIDQIDRGYFAKASLVKYGVNIFFNPLLVKRTTLVCALLPGVGAIIRKGSVGLLIDLYGLGQCSSSGQQRTDRYRRS